MAIYNMFCILTLAAGLIAGTTARPAGKKGSGFIIKQVSNPHYVRTGMAELEKVQMKWGVRDGDTAITPRDDGSVAASPSPGNGIDAEFLCPVNINGQVFHLDFDTGSSDLWVMGPQIDTQGHPHTTFSPNNGDQPVSGQTWTTHYADGNTATGIVYTETVNIGPVQVTQQAVEVATSCSDRYITNRKDGLVGLAFSKLNKVQTNGSPTPQKTFLKNAIDQGILSKPIMGANLKHAAPGSYDFGFIRSNKSLSYLDVDDSKGFWAFTPAALKMNGGQPISTSSSLTGIADTGTSLMILPGDIAAAYYQNVPGASLGDKHYTFPCSTTLPDFQIVIDAATTITIPGQYMNFAPVSAGSSSCTGGLQPSTTYKQNIYGDIFLKSAYVVFDSTAGAPRLGFASDF